jgi:PAS domain S-box-containing protein
VILPIALTIILGSISGFLFFLWQKSKKELASQKALYVSTNTRASEIVATLQHITSEKQLLAVEKNKLEVAISGISDAIIAVDFNRKITIFNTSAENLTGFTKEESLGHSIEEIIRFFDKGKEITPQEYCPTPLNMTDIKLVGKNGKESSVNLLSGQIHQDQEVGCVLTLHDITKEDALEAMKLDFVSMAAHELRTPLTSIRGYLSVFMEENSKNLNSEQNMLLGRINTAAQQLMALIENLLSVSKIERGVFGVSVQPLDWVTDVKEVVEVFKDRAEEKKQTLEFIPPTEAIPTIQADKLRINEVLSNLLANAIAYTPERGQISVSIESKDNFVTTHIKDNGVGIPPEALPHLFTKFFRISGKLEQGSKGTGLGLYISKSVVDMHKGKIWVDSILGHGSTFSFSIPIQQNQP